MAAEPDKTQPILAQRPRPAISWRFRLTLLLSAVLVGGLGWAGLMALAGPAAPTPDPTLWALGTALASLPSATPVDPFATPEPSDTPAPTRSADFGTLIYAARESGRTRLFAHTPGDAHPIPLTAPEEEARDPAFSPDGRWLAYAARDGGAWDLYMLDLHTLETVRLTDTPGYDGSPTWSPDGRWLAYETYQDGDLDLWVLPVDGGQAPIQLTNQPGLDLSPSWDPNGRRIAFVSDRDGSLDIFLADLDNPDERFRNLTHSPDVDEIDPAFDDSGTLLAYSVRREGLEELVVVDLRDPAAGARSIGQGRQAAWSPDGLTLAAILRTAGGAHLVTYPVAGAGLIPLGLQPAGEPQSITWSAAGLPAEAAAYGQSLPAASPRFAPPAAPAEGRERLVEIEGLAPPHNLLSERALEPFLRLRERVTRAAGWDFLASLEHAFVGLNDPLPPGYAYNDWLYTGRAFAFHQAAFQAGWVELMREDIGGLTYWRVYVRVIPQDGSLGEPLRERPWNFEARFGGDPAAYDRGGGFRPAVPAGYYIDFTRLAADEGFTRLPALSNWRTFYPGARFNEFAYTEELDWNAAMLELYPAEAIRTPTPYRTLTPTPTITPRPTATPWWLYWRTPSATPTPSPTPTATAPASPTPTP